MAALVVATVLGCPIGARATHAAEHGGWQFEVMPYLWLTELHGSVDVRDRGADLDLGYDEIFDLLGDGDLFAAMGHVEARRGRLALFADVVGTVIDTDTSGQIARQRIEVDLDSDVVTVELGAAYRVLERGRVHVEGLAGGRYNYWYAKVAVEGPFQRRSRDTSQHFVDPFFGLRGAVRLVERLSLLARADVGGFGAGSELAWSVLGGLHWDMPWQIGAADLVGFAGYKVYDVDYETGAGDRKRELDIQFRGPALGLGFTF